MDLHVDLGQIIITGGLVVVSIIGYFIKQEVVGFKAQILEHQRLIMGLVADVQRLIGIVGIPSRGWNGYDRRNE